MRYLMALIFVVGTRFGSGVGAAEIRVTADGEPLAGAVVLVQRTDAVMEIDDDSIERDQVNIDQIDREFVPALRIVRPGTRVAFPNHDDTHHHVYSFSSAKTFELPLYRGAATDPVVFETAGLVTLGCNIHDWMQAHVVITDADIAAVTDATGVVSLAVPDGIYEISVWHPRVRGERFEMGMIDANVGLWDLSFDLQLAPDVQRRRPRTRDRDY
jgi:plastocyanin